MEREEMGTMVYQQQMSVPEEDGGIVIYVVSINHRMQYIVQIVMCV